MLIRLSGGPYDDQVVEPTGERVAIPSTLGFGARGEAVSISGDAKGTMGLFTDWRIRDPVIPAGLQRQPSTYTATYRRTDRTTPDGMVVFDFIPVPVAFGGETATEP